MLTKIRTLIVSIVIVLLGTTVMAQSACADIVTRALEKTSTVCQNPIRNTICYGNGLIFAQAQTGVILDFDGEGDVAAIEDFAGITHTSLDETTEIWGVSLMSLQADLPDTLPGQAVQVIVFGSVEVDDVSLNAFRFTTGVGASSCTEAPSNGIMVRTPEGVAQVTLNINEVEISMGSTAFIAANEQEGMTVTMLDGTARVTAQGVSQSVNFSQKLNIPLTRDPNNNLVPSAPPTPAESWDAAEIAKNFTVYSTLNKLGTNTTPIQQPTVIQQPLVTNTPLPPLPTFTPVPTIAPIPCTISTTSNSVITRVGPGVNRGTFIFLEPNKSFSVTGKKIINEATWWQLNKFEVTSAANSVNELWVAESDVTEAGNCELVIDVDAPPIIRIPPTAAPQPTAAPTNAQISPTPGIVLAVEPSVFISVDDDDIMMGECTLVFVNIEFISAAYFDGPGFVGDTTVEGPEWETNVCPPDDIGAYTYTLDVFSLTGNLTQYFVTIEVF